MTRVQIIYMYNTSTDARVEFSLNFKCLTADAWTTLWTSTIASTNRPIKLAWACACVRTDPIPGTSCILLMQRPHVVHIPAPTSHGRSGVPVRHCTCTGAGSRGGGFRVTADRAGAGHLPALVGPRTTPARYARCVLGRAASDTSSRSVAATAADEGPSSSISALSGCTSRVFLALRRRARLCLRAPSSLTAITF
jgi:hypothetical protein